MRMSSSLGVRRFLLLPLFALVLSGMAAFFESDLVAQDEAQKPEKKKDEVIDPNAKKPKKAITVDEDDEPVIKVPNKPQSSESSDLAAALKETKSPVLKDLYRALAVPH